MTDLEKLAVAQAAYKALGALVSTKDADSLRGKADAQLIAQFRDDGTDRKRLMVGGKEVGKLSLAVTPPKTKVQLYLDDAEALAAWLSGDGKPYLRTFLATKDGAKLLEHIADALVADGVVPDGCEAAEVAIPQSLSTKITGCRPQDVADALGGALPETFVGLLMEGDAE